MTTNISKSMPPVTGNSNDEVLIFLLEDLLFLKNL